jgi:hypothetical protein
LITAAGPQWISTVLESLRQQAGEGRAAAGCPQSKDLRITAGDERSLRCVGSETPPPSSYSGWTFIAAAGIVPSMQPRPIHRSLLFWLGLPGLLFLGWLWLFVPSRSAWLGNYNNYYKIQVFPDAVEIVIVNDPSGRFRWNFETDEPAESDRAHPFKPVFASQKMILPSSTTYTYVSARRWIPLVVYSIGWLGVLAGWQLHKARLSRQDPLPP